MLDEHAMELVAMRLRFMIKKYSGVFETVPKEFEGIGLVELYVAGHDLLE
jgi:hypothetical protein